MRKRNCDKLFDNIFWYTLYLLPVIVFLGYYFSVYHDTGNAPAVMEIMLNLFDNGMGDLAFSFIQENMMYMLEFFYTGSHTGNAIDFFVVLCCGHFVLVYLFHLFVDFLLFIPRLCHKWMKDFTQGD